MRACSGVHASIGGGNYIFTRTDLIIILIIFNTGQHSETREKLTRLENTENGDKYASCTVFLDNNSSFFPVRMDGSQVEEKEKKEDVARKSENRPDKRQRFLQINVRAYVSTVNEGDY